MEEKNFMSLNLSKLILFIKKETNKNQIIKFQLPLYKYQYYELINNLSKFESYDISESSYLKFYNNDLDVKFYFNENIDILKIIDNNTSSNLTIRNLLQNKNIKSDLTKTNILIKDNYFFNISLIEKSKNLFQNYQNSKHIIENNNIIKIKYKNQSFNIVYQNEEIYFIDFEKTFQELEKEKDEIELLIKFIKNFIFNNIIFECDLYKDKYKELLTKFSFKPSMNLMIEDLLDKINLSYFVFDKTDGERVHLMIYNNNMIYIDILFRFYFVKTLDKSFNGDLVILDCEFYKNEFHIFDLLYHNNYSLEDINSKSLIEKFDIIKKYKKEKNISNFIIKEFIEFDIKNEKSKEIFFRDILLFYKKQKNNKDYNIDGLIFQSNLSLNEIKRNNIKDYKWKPQNETSIDFYVKFNNEIDIIKSFNGENLLKLNLYVGEIKNDIENIVYFDKCFLKVDKNFLSFTKENEIIISDIVIEFIPDIINDNIDNELKIDKDDFSILYDRGFNWIPLRIRKDKTLLTLTKKIKYGNNKIVAEQLIEYILNPIHESFFEILSNNYDDGYIKLQQKILNKKIKTTTNKYDSKIFDFIKTNILISQGYYLSSNNNLFKEIKIIDIHCRNGLDILKAYSFGILFNQGRKTTYIGYNENQTELLSNINGAISRYNNFRLQTKYSNFFKMDFQYINNILNIETNKKFNILFCFEFYRYQYSYNSIVNIKDKFYNLLEINGYIFLIVADLKNNIEINDFINKNFINNFLINKESFDIIKIFSNQFKIIENNSFNDYLDKLELYRNNINNFSNKNNINFLKSILEAKDNINKEIFKNLRFIILQKIK